MTSRLRLHAYAKINLQLRVLGARPDGYHELRTVFQAISLHDTLELERVRRPGIDLAVSGAPLDPGPSNLVWRALDALTRELGLGGGWRCRLEKRIPMAAGLGGGSSDAAAVLVAAERLAGRRLEPERRVALAAALGSDVPFFLAGGRALGAGRGEVITPLDDGPRRWVVIVQPCGIAVPTRDAYAWLRPRLTTAAAAPKLCISCPPSWASGDAKLRNDFEAAVFLRHPRLRRIKRRLLLAGAAGAALAGSGSAVYGMFRHPAQARRAARQFLDDRVFIARTLTRGEFRRLPRARERG